MSQKEEQVIEKLGLIIPNMPEKQKEYFAGVVDGIALMSEPVEKKVKENEI